MTWYEKIKTYLEENRQLFILSACFVLVFISGFATGRVIPQDTGIVSSSQQNYNTRTYLKLAPAAWWRWALRPSSVACCQAWNRTKIHSFFLIGLVVVFCIFSVFVWKERALDEREEQQRLVAGRIGFLAGAGLLVVGIINQTINHELDSWLLIALTGMVIAKLVTRLYMHLRD
jgi:hypothetical protein